MLRLENLRKDIVEEALQCARYSDMVYRDEKDIDVWVKFKFIQNAITDTQVIIFKQNDTVYIVFRGTEIEGKLKDIATDINACPISARYITGDDSSKIHKGFYKAYRSVQKTIFNELENHHRYDKVIVTGHSLGGALATICAIDLKLNFRYALETPDVELFTFGSPRVGNEFYAMLTYFVLNEHCYRFVNAHDPVTMVPPVYIGFKHISDSIQIDASVKIPVTTLISSFFAQVFKGIGKRFSFDSSVTMSDRLVTTKLAEYHSISNYIEKIANYLQKLYSENI